MTIEITATSNEDAIKQINTIRKANKNKWCFVTLIVNNEVISIKFFNTYIQRLNKNGVRHHGTSGDNNPVSEFSKAILTAIEYGLVRK